MIFVSLKFFELLLMFVYSILFYYDQFGLNIHIEYHVSYIGSKLSHDHIVNEYTYIVFHYI